MFQLLYSYIHPFVQFNDREKRIFESAFSFRQVPKKYKLIEVGDIAREFYFVNKGLLRLYYEKDGEEIAAFFFREGLFASSYDSFLREQPGIQALDALEDTDLLVLSKQNLEELYTALPVMNILTRKISEQRFINAQQILSSFILDSPEERYRKFELMHKDLLQRVPQHMIASFLGITPVSLSRIRKRIL
jgi:CRP/FNR family transcriptional regulator, anaerobic regulatory protein